MFRPTQACRKGTLLQVTPSEAPAERHYTLPDSYSVRFTHDQETGASGSFTRSFRRSGAFAQSRPVIQRSHHAITAPCPWSVLTCVLSGHVPRFGTLGTPNRCKTKPLVLQKQESEGLKKGSLSSENESWRSSGTETRLPVLPAPRSRTAFGSHQARLPPGRYSFSSFPVLA